MRYAVYLTPPKDSPLATAAEGWLGRSAFTGGVYEPAAPMGALPEVPARYGFHATLRAPFRLAIGVSEEDLTAAFAAHAIAHPPIATSLSVGRLAHFLALTADDHAPLAAAAEETLRAFEPLRAPLTMEERARRKPDALDERGRQLLDRWGYPHVMERFTFHMTLTGPMEPEDADAVEDAAHAYFDPLLSQPHTLVYALFREDVPGGPFHVIATQDARP